MTSRLHRLLAAAGVAALAFTVSCTSDTTPEPPQTECFDSTYVVSYVNDIVPIVNTYCSNPSFGDCHQNGASNPNLTSYDQLKALIDAGVLQDRVFGPFATGQRMPPGFSTGPTELANCDKQLLDRWIEQGYPNN